MRQIILASQSRQRQNLFKTLDLPFEVLPADLDERSIQHSDLKLRAQMIAQAKAEFAVAKHPDAIVIAADTYVVADGEALEKPLDPAEAKQMLQRQSGRWTVEYSGFCYLDRQEQVEIARTSETQMLFRPLSEAEIDRYVANEPVMEWSAAFCPAYDTGMALVERINGSFTSFTHGLPIEWVIEGLRKSGVEI